MSHFRKAESNDIASILQLMEPYYREDGYPFSVNESRLALESLLENGALGQLWVAILGAEVVGYLAVTLGFSLEYRGIDAFVDELFLAKAARGQCLGGEALRVAEEYCRSKGVRALHLEVERHREPALELYRKSGFIDHDRVLMTKQLQGG